MIPRLKEFISKNKLLLIAFFVCYLSMLAIPRDPDFGWHYKYGESLVLKGRFIRDNTFSYNMTEYKWANSYALSQIYLFIVFNDSLQFLSIHVGTLVYCIFLFLLLYIWKKDKAWIYSIPFITIQNLFNITSRPLGISTLFFIILHIILDNKNAGKYLKFLPILFLIWANTHADFTLGLFILGIYFCQLFFTAISHNEKLKYTFILATSFFVTLVNPNGLNLYKTFFLEVNTFQFIHIEEWKSIYETSSGVVEKVFKLLNILLITIITIKDKKSQPYWKTIVILFFGFMSLKSIYFYRIFLIVSLEVIINTTLKIINSRDDSKKIFLKGFNVLTLIFTFLLLVKAGEKTIAAQSFETKYRYINFPINAYMKAQKINLKGNVLNVYQHGGVLIKEFPEIKTFIDGRMPSWRTEEEYVFKDYISITTLPKENKDLIEKYINEKNITWAVLHKKTKLTTYLQSIGWKIEYTDGEYVLLIKN